MRVCMIQMKVMVVREEFFLFRGVIGGWRWKMRAQEETKGGAGVGEVDGVGVGGVWKGGGGLRFLLDLLF